MRRLAWLTTTLAVSLLLFPAFASAQDRSPELQKLDYFVGEWTYGSEESPGSMHFEWFGSFLRCTEVTSRGVEVLHIWGYDPDDEVYRGCRYYETGYADCFHGWFSENQFAWVVEGRLSPITKIAFNLESPSTYTFQWSRMVEGGDWEDRAVNRAVKVR